MTELEYVQNGIKSSIDFDLISEIETIYGVSFSNSKDVKNYLSYIPNDYFCGSWRVLSSKEIKLSDKWMIHNYIANKVIPLVDIGDLDYISYIPAESKWAIVNDGDGVVFNKKDKLSDYLNQ